MSGPPLVPSSLPTELFDLVPIFFFNNAPNPANLPINPVFAPLITTGLFPVRCVCLISRTLNANGLRSSSGCMMFAKNPTVSSTTPPYTPAILAVTSGRRCGRVGRRRAWGAGMMRGSRQRDDAVRIWACSATDDSPMMASRVMTSKRQPGRSCRPQGNLFGL